MKLLGFALIAALCLPALADEGHHHEDLTSEQLGTVHFPVSCSAPSQKAFERGVALLHSFWYEESEKEFQQIANDDAPCAMAHWGIAMSLWHQLWNEPDAATVRRGWSEVKKGKSLHPSTGRERDYLNAVGAFYKGNHQHADRVKAYQTAMRKVYERYKDDREATVFYALSLLAGDADANNFAGRKEAAAILEKLFAEQPDHPGVAHYLIHSYDKPQLAQAGLPAARRYAEIAPAAPHALHMPSHIFARLGLWQDDIDSNLASIAATRKTAAMHMGGEGHQFHAMDYLVYAYMQSGRESEAWKVYEEVKAMPPMKDMYGEGYDPRAFALAAFPARYALELHRWKEAAELTPVEGAQLGDSSITYWARAIGAARSGNDDQARKDLAQLDSIHAQLLAKKKDEFAEAVEQDRDEAAAWVAHAEGKHDEATAALRKLAEKQESSGEESDGGIPAREMLGDLLMEMKQPQQALLEYETELKFYPKRFNGLYGAASSAEAVGKGEAANSYYAQLLKSCHGANSERPELAQAKAALEQPAGQK